VAALGSWSIVTAMADPRPSNDPDGAGGAAAGGEATASAVPAPPETAGGETGQGRAEPVATPPWTFGSLVFTVLGNVYIVVGTLVMATLTVLTGWIPLPGGGKLFFVWARLWSQMLLLCSGVRWRREVLAPLDRRQTYVFLANHQSLFDIPALLATLPMPARFMAKKELFDVPVFGWSLRVGGFIPVERGAGKSARESFRAATKLLETGGSVLLFPEETRSLDGNLLPFKRGGFLLAQQAALPVVPVGIQGTLGVRRRNSLRIHPGRVLVRYGEPLAPVTGKRENAELFARTRRRIAELAGVPLPAEEPAAAAEPVAEG
jgi:1-acyl-sn-glycerol-3-phosphate acyltransferase